VLTVTALVATVSPFVQPHLLDQISKHPWGYVFPALAIAGLFGMRHFNTSAAGKYAFAFSCMYMTGIAASTAFGVFPYVLPSTLDPSLGLTVYNSAAAPHSLEVGLAWFIPALLLAIVYLFVAYRSFAGKVTVEEEGY
jgi:cytochrome d ubiquinol oxidase subunit II